jgi:hypothetical protein
MILKGAPGSYDAANEQSVRDALVQEDRRNAKKGETLRFGRNEALIQSPDGSWWALKVDDAGVVSTEARA